MYMVLYRDEVIPVVYPQFPYGGQVLEYFVGVLYGLALFSDLFVVFLSAYLFLYCGTFCLARVVDLVRCFSDSSGDGIVLVERW